MKTPLDTRLTQEQLDNVYLRCRLACGMEAANYDLPSEIGYYLHDTIIESYVNDWSDEEFAIWSCITVNVFSMFDPDKIADLYGDCQDVIDRYAQYVYGQTEEN